MKIFATLATVAETIVFLYMGMGFFTSKLQQWNITFSLWAIMVCVIARICNIFPLSCLSNMCRRNSANPITWKMQCVLCFAGLRGAIAFALALNMPGPNAETYTTVTLTICAVTTIICGGGTERVLTIFGMKETDRKYEGKEGSFDDNDTNTTTEEEEEQFGLFGGRSQEIKEAYDGLKGIWVRFDYVYLRPMFGGSNKMLSPKSRRQQNDGMGHYELGTMNFDEEEEAEEAEDKSR